MFLDLTQIDFKDTVKCKELREIPDQYHPILSHLFIQARDRFVLARAGHARLGDAWNEAIGTDFPYVINGVNELINL